MLKKRIWWIRSLRLGWGRYSRRVGVRVAVFLRWKLVEGIFRGRIVMGLILEEFRFKVRRILVGSFWIIYRI